MTGSDNGSRVGRRSLLAGVAGVVGAAALPATAAHAAPHGHAEAGGRRYPENWPDLEPYGLADTREDLWPREDNSFVLPLEPRPRDRELGRVWMRDTYVNCFIVRGRPLYVATGTTRVPGLQAAAPWNDGIFVWTAPSLRGPWRLVDTTRIRPGAEKGKVWSPEFVNENREGRTVVAPWQEYWSDERFGKRGQVWAPEVHCFRGKWYIVACMGDHSRKVGSFLLVSEGGIEGPYRLAEGNLDKPFGESFIGGPDFIEPGAYHHIDGSTRHAYDPPGPGRTQYQYDAVVAVADRFEGPYSKRWTLGVGAGHNNLFRDHAGRLWATFFRNPNAGYWADPSRTGDAAVPGVVRLEWTGPRGDRLYVQRRRGH